MEEATEHQEATESETITCLRVQARNNYTQRNAQDITAWRKSTGPITQVDVAIGLDEVIAEDIERRGYSGMGAGAILLATIDGDEEEISNLFHPSVRALPAGSLKSLRHYISENRGREVWDGHNHVCPGTPHCQKLLKEMGAK